MRVVFGKNLVTAGKNSGFFQNRPVPSQIFPFFPVTTVFSGKTFQTFSGIQFLSYSVQNWYSPLINLAHSCLLSTNSQKPNSIYHMKKDNAMVRKISKLK
jgi:hypothetical protein